MALFDPFKIYGQVGSAINPIGAVPHAIGSPPVGVQNVPAGTIFDPTTDMQIQRLYDGSSAILNQSPSALDTPLTIQFGAVEGTGADPVQTIASVGAEASILRINEAGTYRIKIALQLGRSTTSGVAILNFRALVNGAQAGRSVNYQLQNASINQVFTDEAWLTVPAGVEISYEVVRDSGGANSGGLIAGTTSGSTGWNAAPSCSLRVERWIPTP